MADIWNHHNYTATPEETCGVALRAGTDLDCSTFYKDHAAAALASGDLAEADVDAALRHLFRVQFRLGLFDPSEQQAYTQVSQSVGVGDVCTDARMDGRTDGMPRNTLNPTHFYKPYSVRPGQA